MKHPSDQTVEKDLNVPILAKIWHEDDVWNVCAFDLAVVSYGDDLESARENFIEAIQSHFEALKHFKELDEVSAGLRALASERGFYLDRVKPQTMVENFAFPESALRQLSHA